MFIKMDKEIEILTQRIINLENILGEKYGLPADQKPNNKFDQFQETTNIKFNEGFGEIEAKLRALNKLVEELGEFMSKEQPVQSKSFLEVLFDNFKK